MITAPGFLCSALALGLLAHAPRPLSSRAWTIHSRTAACAATARCAKQASVAASNARFAGTDRIQLAVGTCTLIRGELTLGSIDQDLALAGVGAAQTPITTDVEVFSQPRNRSLVVSDLSVRARRRRRGGWPLRARFCVDIDARGNWAARHRIIGRSS